MFDPLQIPDGGVRMFPTNRYVVQLIRDKHTSMHTMKQDECKEHKLPLIMFCDNAACQQLICQRCFFLKHRNHEIKDLPEKQGELEKQLDEMIKLAQDAMTKYTTQIEKCNDVINEINKVAEVALEKIEETKNKMIGNVVQQTAELMVQVREQQQREIKTMNETLNLVEGKKAKVVKILMPIGQAKTKSNIQDMVENQSVMEQLYEESLWTDEDTKKCSQHYQTCNFVANNAIMSEMQPVGKVTYKVSKLDCSGICQELGCEGELKHGCTDHTQANKPTHPQGSVRKEQGAWAKLFKGAGSKDFPNRASLKTNTPKMTEGHVSKRDQETKFMIFPP